MIFFSDKTDAARYVEDITRSLRKNCVLTMITTVDEFGGCSVTIATIDSSEDTGMQRSSDVSRRIFQAVQTTISLIRHEEKERRRR